MRQTLLLALAVALISSVGLTGSAQADTVRGVAAVGYLQPVLKRDGKDIVTTIKVKNLSKGTIAGLKVEEYWYDKDNNPLSPGSNRLAQPLAPGALGTIVIRMPADERMHANNYQFSHDNGTVKATLYAKFQE